MDWNISDFGLNYLTTSNVDEFYIIMKCETFLEARSEWYFFARLWYCLHVCEMLDVV